MRAQSTKHTAHSKGKIFVISGPSGSGKTTLRDRLLKDKALNKKLAKSVSFTTRPKRRGERNGKDYFFISPGDFIKAKKAKKILEWTKYLGYYYATSKDYVARAIAKDRSVVLCLDLRGARQIKKLFPGSAVTIFIKPPSVGALQARITKRCCQTAPEEVRRRLRLANKELRDTGDYDYVLVNRYLEKALNSLRKIVLRETGQKEEC